MQSCSVNPAVWTIQNNYEYTKEQRREQWYFFALYVFYKKRKKYIKKLLNIHIFLIDVWNVRWYNRAYRMTKSQFVFLIELAVR